MKGRVVGREGRKRPFHSIPGRQAGGRAADHLWDLGEAFTSMRLRLRFII